MTKTCVDHNTLGEVEFHLNIWAAALDQLTLRIRLDARVEEAGGTTPLKEVTAVELNRSKLADHSSFCGVY